jgi:UDP-galactopyranose mutase
MFDYLIVGAGLFGITAARVLTDAGRSVLVVERRPHVAGNCYDENWGGCYVNRYGGHIFHTNSRRIWDFLGRFTEWRAYEHRVKAHYQGRTYSLPPNRATFDQIGCPPGPEGEQRIREMFFEGYTAKQWGRPIEDVPASVLARIPIRRNYDDRYFSDRYQGLPEHGYTRMVERMLAGIPVQLNADFLADREYWRTQARRVIYSGPIDALFGCDLGRLAYRSLEFRTERLEVDDYQGCATINYTDAATPWTRILEWKHFGWRKEPKGETVVTMEYPRAAGEPYYPVEDEPNLELYARYAARMGEMPWLRCGGRLGSYRYYNMDQVVAQAIAVVESERHYE